MCDERKRVFEKTARYIAAYNKSIKLAGDQL
jgi:hypothetical protein